MKYSVTNGGILVMIAGMLLAQYGFSESCSNEIIGKASPLLGALPGLLMAWYGRVRQGDVNFFGVKK